MLLFSNYSLESASEAIGMPSDDTLWFPGSTGSPPRAASLSKVVSTDQSMPAESMLLGQRPSHFSCQYQHVEENQRIPSIHRELEEHLRTSDRFRELNNFQRLSLRYCSDSTLNLSMLPNCSESGAILYFANHFCSYSVGIILEGGQMETKLGRLGQELMEETKLVF